MKLKLMIAFLLSGLVLYSQPVLEHTYAESASLASLEKLGEVYYSMDVIGKQCLIYDMDHSLLKGIPLPTPEGYYLEDIQHLSEQLFNEDDLLELVYIYSKYVSTEFSYYFSYETKLINENGTILLTVPGAGYTEVVESVAHGKKFLVYQYDYSVIPFRTYTQVYALPDQTEPSKVTAIEGFNPGDAYPNPGSQIVTIPATLPDGVGAGSLEIYDMQGRKILRYPLSGSSTNVQLAAGQLTSGTYLYKVSAGDRVSEARKIVIR